MKAIFFVTKTMLLIAIAGVAFAALTAGVGGMPEAHGTQLCAAPAAKLCVFAIF